MRARLHTLWNLRNSPDHRVRLGWYLAVLGAFVGIVEIPVLWGAGIVLLAVWCIFLFSIAGVWGLFHPRHLWAGRQSIWRWALGATVLILMGGYVEAVRRATGMMASTLPTASALTVLMIVLLILFALSLVYGWMGAAISAYSSRRWHEPDRLTRVGVNTWWLLSMGYVIVVWAPFVSENSSGASAPEARAFLLLIPLLTILMCRLALNPEREPRRLVERLLNRLTRYLTFRRRWRGRTLTVDLRGPVLGLLVAATVFGFIRPVLKAPSASLLVWMIQVRNQETQGAWNDTYRDGPPSIFGSNLIGHDREILEQRHKIVLIDLDAPALRAAFAPSLALASSRPKDEFDLATIRSEAALNALLIRRLQTLGAAVIVLSPPQERLEPSSDDKDGVTSTTTIAERERSKRDEPLLLDAVKQARNVVLALPSREGLGIRGRTTPYVALIEASQEAGQEQLVSYGSVRIPVLESGGKNETTSLPIVIARLYARLIGSNSVYGYRTHSLTPVDFRNARPSHDFMHIVASSLLAPEIEPLPNCDVAWTTFRKRMREWGASRLLAPMPVAETRTEELILAPNGQWKTLPESIQGSIVFLDTPVPHMHETPVGALPAREVLAYATATVLAHEKGLRVPTIRSLWLTLLVGVVMGALCAHRTPFEAVGRLIAMSALMLVISLGCYIVETLWLDAVTPLAAISMTYLLVTQLAFTQEREKNRDLLKRFIAPEFVDAMLEHPEEHLGLAGKLSHVCVLFADVRNFTGFAERHTPEQVFEAVNQYMTALTNALHAYGGVLDKYTGDGLMAWFPAAIDSQLQIANAVEASLAMRDAALAISRTRAEQDKPCLHFGIGMHYGEAMIGLVGNEEHQINYTALGHAVIVSARLQSLAAGGEVVISEAVYAALGETFQVEARAPVAVKGISELVHPYHVLSAVSA